jgi:exopolysaccharide production protein ExoZ
MCCYIEFFRLEWRISHHPLEGAPLAGDEGWVKGEALTQISISDATSLLTSSGKAIMQQFNSIHYLRAIAALMVVVLHIHTGISFMRHNADEIGWLRGGVDIFFIISGFVMVKSTYGKNLSGQDFFYKRCQRIIPLYWLATLVSMASIQGEFLFKLGSMFFVPMANPDSGALEPVVEPGWTLNYEMFFYLLFSVSLLLKEQRRFWAIAALLSALSVMSLFVPDGGVIGFYTNPILLEFLFGMAIAKFKLKGPVLLVPCGFTLMYMLYPLIDSRVISLGLPAALIIIGAVGSEHRIRRFKLLGLLGDASYSIYIFHLLALGVFVKHWERLGINTSYFAPVALIFVVVMAVLLHWFLERPIIAFFARRNAQSPDRSASAADSIFKRQASKAAFKIE